MLQPGDRIGRYEIQRRLGRGGMGTVYVAHDPVLGRLVALKMFAGDLDVADAAEKFAREARAAAALNHTNIVTIHDFGEFDSQPFIVMEYIQGDTLARMIRKKADLSLSERLRLIEELCAAVAYAHGYEVIHRDIKPANLMVDRANRLKVLDFGIARMVGTSLSKGTALIGTPGYMAPEQIRGGTIDRRCDLFSIGVVTYELLSYVEAFPGDSVPAITHRILTEEPLPLMQLVEDLPDELVGIVERALKKDPADRYPDAASMGAAIAKVRAQADGDPRFATLRPTLQGSQAPRPPAGGTGSSNQTPGPISSNAAVTPSSDSPRQAQLIRKRTEQIERALAKARAELHEGRLQDAHETCLEALSLSETHPGALQLEKEIDVALAQSRARELVAEGRAALDRGAFTLAEGAVRDARELDSTSIDVRQLERDLRIRRAEHVEAQALAESVREALQRGHAALVRSDVEAALTAARQARRLDPSSEDARRLEAGALRQMDLETGVGDTSAGHTVATDAPTIVVPAAARPAPPPPVSNPVAAEPIKSLPPPAPSAASVALAQFWTATQAQASRAGHAVTAFSTITAPQAFRSATRSMSQATARAWGHIARPRPSPSDAPVRASRSLGGRAAMLAWSAGGLILVAGAALATWLYSRPAPDKHGITTGTTGSVTIDALPWATVTSIVGAGDRHQTLPEDPSTPLTIVLPVGVYRVSLVGPQAGAPPRELTVTVVAGQTVAVDGVTFPPLSAESYFDPYLVSHQEPAAADATGSGSVETVSDKTQEKSR